MSEGGLGPPRPVSSRASQSGQLTGTHAGVDQHAEHGGVAPVLEGVAAGGVEQSTEFVVGEDVDARCRSPGRSGRRAPRSADARTGR